MTRIGKKQERRAISPRKHRSPSLKTGPKRDNLPEGYRLHENALDREKTKNQIFIAKVK
ncbi:MAG: hypothetical protein KDK55_04365 [Chlamydiia bacterium]|nr:hypothetical protein [Chlamydiia bacterium]